MGPQQNYDVVIIGAGIMGSATGFYTAQDFPGKKVLVLEQFNLLHSTGSSHGPSRIIRLTYEDAHYTALMKVAYSLWASAERQSGFKVYTKTGGIDFAKKGNKGLNDVIKSALDHDIRHEMLTPKQVHERFPTISLPDDFECLYSPDAGILNATESCRMFQSLAKSRGCEFRELTTVVNIDSSNPGHITLRTNRGEEIVTKKCIITAGPWTTKLLKSISGISMRPLPLRTVQTTAAYWKVDSRLAEAYDSKRFPIYISYEHHVYGFPCHEVKGAIKCCYHDGPDMDPDNRSWQPGLEDLKTFVTPFLKEVFQGVNADMPVKTESCMYTWSPDADFILDKLPGNDNLIIGCGFSGHGFKLSPIVGKILSTLAIVGTLPKFMESHIFRVDRKAIITGEETRLSKL